jgi:hypothetical protein
MVPIDRIKRKSRRNSAEPQPLHIPAPEREEREEDRRVDEDKTGSHVIVIDIS